MSEELFLLVCHCTSCLVSNVQETVKKYAGDFDIFQVREGGRDDDVGCSLLAVPTSGLSRPSCHRRSQCLSPTDRPPSALIFRILAIPSQERPKLICNCTLFSKNHVHIIVRVKWHIFNH